VQQCKRINKGTVLYFVSSDVGNGHNLLVCHAPFSQNKTTTKQNMRAARSRKCSLKKDIKCVVVRPFKNRTASTKKKNSRRMKDLKFTTIKRKSFFCCVFFYSEQGNLSMGIDNKIFRR
jgi:hypothetical protein